MSQNLQGANALTFATNSGAFANGSTASQFTNAAAINYAINGVFQTQKAIVASVPLVIEPNTGIVPTAPNTLQTLKAGQSCAFAIILDTAGTFTVAQGDIVQNGSLCSVPQAPAGKAIVGAIKVVNATNDFIPGTTLFSAAGVTTTYRNLAQHPGASI
jgi:hypothetical protein